MAGEHTYVDATTRGYVSVAGWVARCYHSGCEWSYSNVIKSDVLEHARWHRDAHR